MPTSQNNKWDILSPHIRRRDSMTTFKKYHLECPMCDSSDAYALDHDNIGHCFSCGGTYDESSKKKTSFKKPKESMTSELRPVELGVYKEIPSRGIAIGTVEKYRYQVSADGSKHIANVTDLAQKIRFVESKRFLYINKPAEEKLYGDFAFTPNPDQTLVITEGELDAMSINQAANIPAVSITHGTKSAGGCIKANLDYIKGFKNVVIAFDNDAAGLSATEKAFSILKSAGIPHTSLAYPENIKDANDALMNGFDIELADSISEAVDSIKVSDDNDKDQIYYVSKSARFHLKNSKGESCTLDRYTIRGHLTRLYNCTDTKTLNKAIEDLTSIESESFCEDLTLQPYKPYGRVSIAGRPLLNCSPYKTITPVKGEPTKLLRLFKEMLGDEQLPYFIGWLSHFFKGCNAYNLKQSSALYLAGDQGAGKGLFHDVILKSLVGQGADGGMLFSSGFTGKIYEHPYVVFPDTFGELNERERTKFTSLIKNIVANGERIVNHKYGAQENIEWKGRVIVSLNLDEKSAEALPDVHKQDADKFMLLKVTRGELASTLTPEEWDSVVKEEAPYLAYYLLQHKIPDDLTEPRFGVKTFHNKDIIGEIRAQNRNVALAELLQEYMHDNDFEELAISSKELLIRLNEVESHVPECARVLNDKIKSVTFGRKLTELALIYDWVEKRVIDGYRKYVIRRSDQDLYT